MKSMEPDKRSSEPETMTRRRFLNRLWSLFAALAGTGFGLLGLSFFNSRNKLQRPDKKISLVIAGPVDQFPPGTVTAIAKGGFYLSRLDDGSFLALSRTCTHLGCAVPWNEEKGRFVCPCHGSTFDSRGVVLSAPAPRPLDTFPVRIENGIVRVNLSRPAKRGRFDASQTTTI